MTDRNILVTVEANGAVEIRNANANVVDGLDVDQFSLRLARCSHAACSMSGSWAVSAAILAGSRQLTSIHR